jgi:putative hydrolase of the HAD superfamily
LYEDARPTLLACKKPRYSNLIVSNNYPELVLVIDHLGLSDCFTDYIISSNIGYEKPRSEIFRHALDIANNPEISFMIGNNPIADIQGAKGVDMKTILAHNRAGEHADYSCENLSEIPLILL